MSDFVNLSLRAKLRSSRPYQLAKLNAYLTAWGGAYIVSAVLMATEKDANPGWWLIAAALILVTLFANFTIYLRLGGLCLRFYDHFHYLPMIIGGLVLLAAGVACFALVADSHPARQFGGYVNAGQQLLLPAVAFFTAGWLAGPRFSFTAALWTCVFCVVLGLKNPWWYLLETERELEALRQRAAHRPQADSEELPVEPGWDQADGLNDHREAARENRD